MLKNYFSVLKLEKLSIDKLIIYSITNNHIKLITIEKC